MSARDNKERMREIFAETAQGNFDPLVAALADDASWTIKGGTPFSKTYAGKEKILTRLLGPLSTRIEGRLRLEARRLIAEDDLVVVEAQGSASTVAGVPYDNGYCFVFRLEDGIIREITEYMDTQLVMTAFGS